MHDGEMGSEIGPQQVLVKLQVLLQSQQLGILIGKPMLNCGEFGQD